MLYCTNLIHDGLFGALIGFLLWSLPGALGMYGLAIGISNLSSTLPRAVYALLSGLNAATVGIISLAAVELSDKAITDNCTRNLVFLTASAGMLYNALWYFPVLMVACGVATVINDYRWLHRPARSIVNLIRRGRRSISPNIEEIAEGGTHIQTYRDEESRNVIQRPTLVRLASVGLSTEPSSDHGENTSTAPRHEDRRPESAPEPRVIPQEYRLTFSWKSGAAIIAAFLATFIAVMVTRGVLSSPPLLYRLFANMYLAGTIIFGGGPVVIPLLREYVVAEGWVSPRDFLIGLAIAQAFPGPNFNFAVFLGALTASNDGLPSVTGAMVAFVGIFFPGIVLVHGTMGIWSSLRSRPWVKSVVRGVNAGAVGLIYTAVYRIWLVGYLDEGFQSGKSLGDDPWWVVVTATAFVGGRYYSLKAPMAILLGAVLGLARYGVVSAQQ